MILVEITLILVAGWLVAKFGEREWSLLEGDLRGESPSKSVRLDAAEIYDWERE